MKAKEYLFHQKGERLRSNGNKRGIKHNQPVPGNALFRRLIKALKQILFHSYGKI